MKQQNIKFIKTISFAAVALVTCTAGAVQKNGGDRDALQEIKPSLGKYSVQPIILASANIQLPSVNDHRTMVQYSRAMDTNTVASQKLKPAKAESQAYWFNITGSQLKKGVEVNTSGVEALIRISPKSSNNPLDRKLSSLKQSVGNSKSSVSSSAIDLELLEVTAPNGRVLQGQSAMSFSANAEQLSTSEFSQGSSGFKLDKNLSSGRFQLKTNQTIADNQQYTIYVLDKNSPFKLNLEMASQQILAGNRLSAKVQMTRSGKKSTLNSASVSFVAPDGKVFPVKTNTVRNGIIEFNQELKMPYSGHAGLWEMQVESTAKEGQLLINRNNKLAFAYLPRTAKVSQLDQSIHRNKRGLSHLVKVTASHAGRYEATGLLYLVNKDGSKQIIAEARTAKWVEPGDAELALLFKSSLLPKLGKGQYFKVSKIGLNDQSRMSVLE